mgnify:CR=1 FL=1|jgi:uncharacterized membrane protein YqhA
MSNTELKQNPDFKGKNVESQSLVERIFETCLWNSRFAVLLAVVFGLISALTVFVVGSLEVIKALQYVLSPKDAQHSMLLGKIIAAIDLYLIGVVLLLFSFGIYELFISKIDIARRNQEIKVLEISSLDELKNRILKVIIMVLVVSFFQRVLAMKFTTPLEMMYLAISILALTIGIHFMHKQT